MHFLNLPLSRAGLSMRPRLAAVAASLPCPACPASRSERCYLPQSLARLPATAATTAYATAAYAASAAAAAAASHRPLPLHSYPLPYHPSRRRCADRVLWQFLGAEGTGGESHQPPPHRPFAPAAPPTPPIFPTPPGDGRPRRYDRADASRRHNRPSSLRGGGAGGRLGWWASGRNGGGGWLAGWVW